MKHTHIRAVAFGFIHEMGTLFPCVRIEEYGLQGNIANHTLLIACRISTCCELNRAFARVCANYLDTLQ